jgi:ABC-type antimicrobial peptide transport system ATPase subunit
MYVINSVIVSRTIPLEKAREMAQKFIKNPNKTYYRLTENSIRFRDYPKTQFDSSTFRTKVINKDISIIYGKLR